jgi:hypothetical protein
MSDDRKSQLVGTPVYDNWRAFLDGAPRLGGYEYVLHSDARLIGEVASGVEPYAFINLVPFGEERGRVRTAVAVRAWVHVDFDIPVMNKTDPSRYHGGDAADEVAALASLTCGVRFRAGNQTRRFDAGGDPVGRPVAWGTRADPVLTICPRGFVLPGATGEHSLIALLRLASFPRLRPADAITVARVARLYQDALWLSESRVAEAFADSLGSTKKFVEFLLMHMPDPPETRPADWGQIEWNVQGLRRSFRQIYGYRSRALHDGMPFPAPMCEPPYRHETWQCFAEKPTGLATSVAGGTWLVKDTPMLLHTFEYIARQSLIKWWASLPAAG